MIAHPRCKRGAATTSVASLRELPKPTIAMVNGPVAGAGLALALGCDLRIAGTSARPDDRLCQGRIFRRFRRQLLFDPLVGTAKARELYFTGRPFEADEALSLGLVNRVVPDEELAAVTVELARSLAHGPSIALSLMKRNLNFAESGGLAELLDMEAAHQVRTGRTEDHREAAKAFVEKRAPIFTGRWNRQPASQAAGPTPRREASNSAASRNSPRTSNARRS